jgi:hypothetical protein
VRRSRPFAVDPNGGPRYRRTVDVSVSGFAPSRDGFPFPNQWPHVAPIRLGPGRLSIGIGDAANGLCGGMVFSVADLHVAGVPMPPDPQPSPGSARFRYLVRRQVESFDWLRLPLRFFVLMAVPDSLRRRHAGRAAWPGIRAEIDAGRLAMVGLIRVSSRNPLRLTQNHQVVAWRYGVDGRHIRLGVYDPNHPGRDDVELRLEITPDGRRAEGLAQSTGEPLVGLLAAPYSPADPRPFRPTAR